MDRRRGFTLLELLVAIAVFALFSAIAYGALDQVLSNRDHIESEQRFWRALSLTFLRLEEDLAQARSRSIRDIDGRSLPPLRGQPTDTRALSEPSLELTRGGVLVFGESAYSDLRRVGYRLEAGVLIRLTWPVLDRAPQTKPVQSTLMEGVESFRVRFYGPSNTWLEEWPSKDIDDELPRGVEVTLEIDGRGEFTRFFLVNG